MERDTQPIVQNWLNSFKVALINEDTNLINMLMDSICEFTQIEDMLQAQSLIKESIHLYERKQNIIAQKLNNLKKNRKFLNTDNDTRRVVGIV